MFMNFARLESLPTRISTSSFSNTRSGVMSAMTLPALFTAMMLMENLRLRFDSTTVWPSQAASPG